MNEKAFSAPSERLCSNQTATKEQGHAGDETKVGLLFPG